MSHSAMSMAEMVWTIRPPPRRLRWARNRRCQWCSMRVGFSPTMSCPNDSARVQAMSVWTLLISPQPVTPMFVSTLTYPFRPTGMERSIVDPNLRPAILNIIWFICHFLCGPLARSLPECQTLDDFFLSVYRKNLNYYDIPIRHS